MKTIFTILMSFFLVSSYGQISIGGKPYSFSKEFKSKSVEKNKLPQVTLTELDFKK